MREIIGNTVVFVIIYILFMLPTYYLPYLGSNSFSLSAIGVAVGAGINPVFWLHLASLMVLAFVAWFRGILIDKKWLTIFPVLATVFDMAPVLSSIPLVPTVMHLLAIIQGVVGTPAVIAPSQVNYKPPRRIQVDSNVPPPALDTPRAILLCISGTLQGRQFPVNKKVYRIGASSKNDLVIAKDDYVSRNHAYLRYEQGSLWLTDQRSRNGTFLNKNRLKDVPLRVNMGDQIQLGNSTFEVIRARGR